MPVTPQHLDGIEERFPELAAHRRTATRLHPRAGSPRAEESSVGGPLLWPADEPWPVCEGPHEVAFELRRRTDVHTERRLRAESETRSLTEAELELLDRAEEPAEVGFEPDAPVELLPVAQLRRADVPDFIGPAEADLAQVLWCPFDHEPEYLPAVTVRWRRAAEITDPRRGPQGPDLACEMYVPEPCVVNPERITEYEYGHLLPAGLRERIEAWEKTLGESPRYTWGRSITNGWKAGGFASWNLSDPRDMVCDCGEAMRLMVKAEGGEWDGDRLWVPGDAETVDVNPTGITIGRGYSLWVWVCPASYDHPVQTSMQ